MQISSATTLLDDRYYLVKLLGEGSYGSVMEAFDTKTKQYVAIKRIMNLFQDLSDSKRIIRELRILRQLEHPNIIKILNVIVPTSENFNEIYVVFEKMDTDLHKLGADYSQVLTIQ
jgi:mitogen-activated protein kinase 1/3